MKKLHLLKTVFLLCALVVGSMNGWATTSTKTEGFETATAGSVYNSTQYYTTSQSDCGIAWTMYYGTVSTDGKIAGSKSAQMRYYQTALTTYGYIMTTTPIYGLSNVSFKAKVGDTKLKMDVSYSTDGETWTVQESAHEFSGTTAENISVDIPSGGIYVKIGVSPSSSSPASGKSFKLIIDDVVFSYTTYTLTFSATNGSISATDAIGATVISGSQVGVGSTLNITASGSVGYAFDGWSVSGIGSSVANTSNTSTTFTMGTENATLTASFVEDVTEYTVTCNPTSHGSVSAAPISALSGTEITLTTTPDFRYFTKSISVTDANSDDVPVTKTGTNTYTISMPASNVTVNAAFGNTYTDALTRELTGITGTSYMGWSGKSSESSAVYDGNSAGGNNSIQMKKTSENSGIITTASGGYARKITVTWNTNTTSGRTLKVWGSNSAFTSINAMTTGTVLGTIVYGTSTELDITGDYQFIGMEGSGGAIYLDEIDVKWETATTAKFNINSACTDGEGNYYGTYSNSCAFVVPAGLNVSAVGVDEGKLVVTNYATGDVVKANTGVMVSATTAGDKTVTLSSETGTEKAGNLLKPSGDTGISAANMDEADTKFYRLTMHGGTEIGFWWGAASGAAFDLTANKAYLAVPNGSMAREGFWFNDEDVTAIDAVKVQTVAKGDYYNLAGQRVAQPTKGLYIVNGKKVIVK